MILLRAEAPMRKVIILLCLTVILLAGAAHFYRDPRVRELFRSAPAAAGGTRQEAAARARFATATSSSGHAADTRPPTRLRPTVTAANSGKGRADSMPNDTVSRALLQAMAARGLSSGISLEVTDRVIRVFGHVESAGRRRAVLALIENGRETRQVDDSGLVIRN